MALIDVIVPDIGDFKNVPVIEILVKPGDEVRADEPLMTLESDKATMEVPAPSAGRVAEILVKVGDRVSMGSAIVRFESAGGGAVPAKVSNGAAAVPPSASVPKAAAAAVSAVPASGRFLPAPVDFGNAHASPSVRRLARELDVDLSKVKGTGDNGRISKEDVKKFLGGGSSGAVATSGGMGIPEIPTVDFSKWGPIETKPMSRIKRISGPHLHRSWLNVPHVTHTDEADITEIEKYRKELDDHAKADKKSPFRVSLLPFLMKASVATLKAFPDFNASLSPEKDALIYKKYYNIGVAVDTPDGLVVPVLKDVDRKGIHEISRELGEISEKARLGKLPATDMQGATFTISSLGGIGGVAFTPIVNAPEVAILGVVRSKMAPVWNGKEFAPRLMLPLCLSYDHRVIDGASAARFTRQLSVALEDLRRLIL
ncbi:MAG: dihydrolipoyllysine-residue acetyltransferase [Hyphomicrobiaceae bacterium]|nr:dihydrolipoyllysine-residue acetyltransferase [Hyphomicrobiaceae bacterium]